jgi:hypothetical protein
VKAALKGGDWHAAKWLLERRAPDIFDAKTPQADSDHGGVKVEIIFPHSSRGPGA